MSEKCSFNTLRFIAWGRLNISSQFKKEQLIPMQKSKANQMVPSILPENWVLASKNCAKVKNEHFWLGFTVGQGQTIVKFCTHPIFVCVAQQKSSIKKKLPDAIWQWGQRWWWLCSTVNGPKLDLSYFVRGVGVRRIVARGARLFSINMLKHYLKHPT
jgi:hypothetical protein